MKKIIVVLILFIGVSTVAQTKFKKGYFISNTGKKTECYIKNKGLVNTPQVFEYKLTETSLIQTGSIENIKEFGFNQTAKFKRFNTKIDKSSSKINSLDASRLSNFEDEILFLEVIVDGEIELLNYKKNRLNRFFYTKEKGSIIPLEYKLFKNSNGGAAKNKNYILQLKNDFPLNNFNYSKLAYTKKDLTSFFMNYLDSNDLKHTKYSVDKNSKSTYNLKLKVNNSAANLKYGNNVINPDIKLDSKNQIKFGIEFEMILPINNNKWGVFIEPSYQSFTSNKEVRGSGDINNNLNSSTVYKSIEIPIGLRHYIFLNNKSKFFASTGVVVDIAFSSSTDIKYFNFTGVPSNGTGSHDLEINNSTNFFLGLGYSYSKFSVEFRINSDRVIATGQTTTLSYNSLSAVLGYQLF